MDLAKLKKQLAAELSEHHLEDSILTECASICNIYHIPPTDLKYKLEALNYRAGATMSEIVPITLETLTAFKAQMQRTMAREGAKKAQVKARGDMATASVNRSRFPGQMMNQARAMDVDPVGPSTSSSAGTAAASTPVKKEPVTISFNLPASHVVFQGAKTDTESKKRRAYRYMYEKISERSEALDQLIDDFADLIKDQYDIEELADPSSGTDHEVTVVGRIWQDPETSSTAKLSEASLWIESSRMLSSGARIALRLDPAITVKGEKDSSVCIASGPFTPESDLLFKPWRAFLDSLNAKKPNVLILVGPFIDISHPKIQNGETDASPSSIFKARFLDPLRKFLSVSPSSIVVLIPSVRDILSRHCVFPQCEFDSELTDSHPRIFLQPNPARFMIDDISFGVTSVDVLFHLRKEELFKRGVEHSPIPAQPGEVATDSMANLCRHLLNQRSFYPIFPVPLELSHDVNLDVSHLDEARMVDDEDLDYAPDVLIVPGRLKRFDKVVSTTLAINPSFLTKGSYAMLSIAKRSETPNLRERLKVELVTQELPAVPAVAPKIEPGAA
ncbi:hypothetical protein EST38_g2463 [Candolleomyces aberdarensis]|uniref:DNA polymerase alpha subunit B n=1 Tax=Candolleomyces aberdarensis TaxID=2316362 RepID=A0A4Q2DSW7_9AGAR|nr:hypothetical protein EST38_g2463 [Candolleomyces aberdarensis]